MERALRAEVVMVAIALLSIHFESKKYRGPSKEKEKEVSTTRTKSSFSLFLLSGELSNSFPLLRRSPVLDPVAAGVAGPNEAKWPRNDDDSLTSFYRRLISP